MMPTVLDAVIELTALVSPTKAGAIAAAIRAHAAPDGVPGAALLASTPAAREVLDRLLEAWQREGTTGAEVAGLLVGASEARLRTERELLIELVWTGPRSRTVP